MIRPGISVNFAQFRAMNRGTRSPVKFLLALFFALAAVPNARTQEQPDVRPLASQVASALEQFNTKSIIVFDFTGPNNFVTPVGGRLADDLSDVLATTSGKFRVIDRARVVRALGSNRVAPETAADPETAVWLAQNIGADVVLVGRLSRDGGSIQLTLDCLLVTDGKYLQSFQATFPLTDRWKTDLTTNIDPDSAIGTMRAPGADPGSSFPHCTNCPAPVIPRAARDQTASGTVTLEVVVGTDGKPRDIRVLKTPDHGLTVAALQAVQKWRFSPARGADRKPIETRIPIEVNFSH
jgi:TonB family protein